MNYPDVCLDIETTGVQPETTNIIQIAAVRFNLKEGTVDPNFFDQCLYPIPTRFWDENTRTWWASMPDTLEGIYARMIPARTVLQNLINWVDGYQPQLWAKPTSFEYPFLESYFREHELQNPFHFRRCMDQNTYIKARHFPDQPPNYEKNLEFVGTPHNALDDVLHQIRVISTCYEATKNG
jgi:DNA polymerase III alpha subunit (gram-positive type)